MAVQKIMVFLSQIRQLYSRQLLLRLEFLGHGEEVYRLEFGREFLDGTIYQAVLLGVEGIGSYKLLNGDDAVALKHQRTQHGLFQLDRLRRHGCRNIRNLIVRFAISR